MYLPTGYKAVTFHFHQKDEWLLRGDLRGRKPKYVFLSHQI